MALINRSVKVEYLLLVPNWYTASFHPQKKVINQTKRVTACFCPTASPNVWYKNDLVPVIVFNLIFCVCVYRFVLTYVVKYYDN